MLSTHKNLVFAISLAVCFGSLVFIVIPIILLCFVWMGLLYYHYILLTSPSTGAHITTPKPLYLLLGNAVIRNNSNNSNDTDNDFNCNDDIAVLRNDELCKGYTISHNFIHSPNMVVPLHRRYGSIVRLKFPFHHPIVLISDPRDVCKLFTTHLAKTKPSSALLRAFPFLRSKGGNSSLAVAEGEEWMRLKQFFVFCASPAFKRAVVKAFHERAEVMIESLLQKMENNRSLKEDDNDDGYPPLNRNSSQRGALINVISPLQKLAADVTAMMVLGTTLEDSSYRKPTTPNINNNNKNDNSSSNSHSYNDNDNRNCHNNNNSNVNNHNVRAGSSLYLSFPTIRRYGSFQERFPLCYYSRMIYKDKWFLEYQQSLANIREFVEKAMFQWIMHCVSLSPAVESEVRAEISKCVAQLPPSVEEISTLKYCGAVVKEVLRLYPPESFVAVRLSESVTLGNGAQEREIPKQCEIHVSINAIHRNPVLYPSPSSFDPSRWMKEDTNQDTVNNERIHVKQEKRETHFRRRKGGDVHDASKPIIDHNHDDGPKESFQPFTYLPFFVPPRNCMGYQLALLQGRLLLCYLYASRERRTTTQEPKREDTEKRGVKTQEPASTSSSSRMSLFFLPHHDPRQRGVMADSPITELSALPLWMTTRETASL